MKPTKNKELAKYTIVDKCDEDGCGEDRFALKLCEKHYWERINQIREDHGLIGSRGYC